MDVLTLVVLPSPTNSAFPLSSTWRNLLTITWKGFGLDAHIGAVFAIVAALVVVALVVATSAGRGWRVTRANFAFAGCGQVDICPDNDVARIAHQAWVELTTR